MNILDVKRYFNKRTKVDEIELLFQNQGRFNTVREYDRIQELVNQEDGARINSKLENGYIDIEYHNRVGEYKAKMLLQLFDKYPEFYQYFLSRFEKVVIQNHRERIDNREIVINNEPSPIYLEDFINQMLSSTEHSYLYLFLPKLKENKKLLQEEEILSLLKYFIIDQGVKNHEIDFFKYLELMDGKFISKSFYFQRAMVDLAFEYHNYSVLEMYMNHQEEKEIELQIFSTLHQKYGFSLLNHSLKHQKDLLFRYQERYPGNFLEDNLASLNGLFQEKIPKFFEKFQHIQQSPSKTLSQEEILSLVFEFFQKIDSTGELWLEFEENIKNGNIILWDPDDTGLRKKMQEKYFSIFNIDHPLCNSNYDEDGNLTDSIVNIPFTFTLQDVFTIVHEFFHFHSNQKVPKKMKDHILSETFSIYFETLTLEFLKQKGYSKEELPVNFRIMDSFANFIIVSPSIFYFLHYMKNGEIDCSFLYQCISSVQEECLKKCHKMNLSEEETKSELIKNGIYENINDSVIQLLCNLNYIYLRCDDSIYNASPYLLGTILAESAIEMGIDVSEILKISERVNEIEDPCEVMEKVGIDLEKYSFQRKSREEEQVSSHLQK